MKDLKMLALYIVSFIAVIAILAGFMFIPKWFNGVKQEAYDSGYNKGIEEGYRKRDMEEIDSDSVNFEWGYKNGYGDALYSCENEEYKEIHEEGYDEGYEVGYDDGWTNGYHEGLTDDNQAYEEGYNDGWNEALE